MKIPHFFNIKIFLFIVFIVLLFFTLFRYQAIMRIAQYNFLQPHTKRDMLPVSTPTPTPTLYSVNSPDGTMKLIMKTVFGMKNTKSYAFFVADSSNNERLLFTNPVDAAEKMTIPDNSWSPDGKYIYLEEDGKGWTDIFVLKTSGDTFPGGEKFLDVPTLFAQRKTVYTMKTVTGWASQTLLILYTTNADGTQGPSFWLDVTSKSFIQLVS